MPVEFRCHACGKRLRTPAANVARPAACPACGEALVVPAAESRAAADDAADVLEEAPDALPTSPGHGELQPHRGGMILSFGLLSWTACTAFGVASWVLGIQDLRAMRAGRMDPAGEGMTRAGLYLGMANVALSVVVGIAVLVGVAYFLLAAPR